MINVELLKKCEKCNNISKIERVYVDEDKNLDYTKLTLDVYRQYIEGKEFNKTFTTAIARGNLVATQFHPEKSQIKGLTLYRNFLEITK